MDFLKIGGMAGALQGAARPNDGAVLVFERRRDRSAYIQSIGVLQQHEAIPAELAGDESAIQTKHATLDALAHHRKLSRRKVLGVSGCSYIYISWGF